MSKTIRLILLIIFVLLFLGLSLLLIFYARGLNFSALFSPKPALQTTGGLYLVSEPRANILITPTPVAKSRPKPKIRLITGQALTNLAPGQYQITITKKGFRPWQKTLTILPGIVTTHPRVILLKQAYDSKEPISDINQKPNLPLPATRYPISNISFDPQTLQLIKRNKSGEIQQIISLQNILNFKPQQVTLKQAGSDIYLLTDSTLFRLSSTGLAGSLQASIVASDINGFDIKNGQLLYWRTLELWSKNIFAVPKSLSARLIASTSAPIKKARWFKDTTTHVIYQVGNALIFSENLAQGNAYQASLALVDPGTKFDYNASTNTLYFYKNKKVKIINFNGQN